MKKESSFLKYFFRIYIALVLQNVVTLSVNLADNMMLGAYSEVSLSGVAAVNQIQFIFQQILFALGEGVVIIGSQYWGKKDTKSTKQIAAIGMYLGIGVSLILFALVSCFPYQALQIFTNDAPIIEEGVRYLLVIRFTYLFFAVSMILQATLRSVEVVKISFYMSIITFCVNCSINFVLIYGRFGAPRLGVVGAAIGTLAARIVECVVLILFLLLKEKNLKLRPGDYFHPSAVLARDYLKTTIPMVFVQGLWGVNTALQTVILGHMTAAAIAANSAASTLYLVVKSMAVGAASTACVIIGKTVGEGNYEKTRDYARKLQKIFLSIGLIGAIVLFFIRIPILSLYDLSPETKEMANQFLLILCIAYMGMSYQMPTSNGIIRGAGTSMYSVKVDLVSIWLIVLPLSFFMAFVVKASPVVVVCCLNADQVFKCVPAFIKYKRGNWIKQLTRD